MKAFLLSVAADIAAWLIVELIKSYLDRQGYHGAQRTSCVLPYIFSTGQRKKQKEGLRE